MNNTDGIGFRLDLSQGTATTAIHAGIDACGGGWIVVRARNERPLRLLDYAVRKTFAEVVEFARDAAAIAVDIPIGLADRGFRECDLRAREMMASFKGRVFKTSPRRAIHAKTKAERHDLHRELTGEGLPPVAAAFAGMVAQADDWMLANGKPQDRVFEVHPELCFRAINGGHSVQESKHGEPGAEVRYRLLAPFFNGQDIRAWVRRILGEYPRSKLKEDDVLDAVVAAVTAATWVPRGTIPGPRPARDSEGLSMEMRCPPVFE